VGPLQPGSVYYWQVKAYRHDSLLDYSDVGMIRPGDDMVFPLGLGMFWQYKRTWSWENCIGQSFPPVPSARSISSVERLDTLHDSIVTAVVRTHWVEDDGSSGSRRSWMRNINDGRSETEDGLFELAYEGTGWVGPAPKAVPEDGSWIFKGRRFRSLSELTREYMPSSPCGEAGLLGQAADTEAPRRWLAYPLHLGKRWDFISVDSGHIWNMAKEVVGEEPVQTPMGTLAGFQIRWYWDIDGDGDWDSDLRCFDDFCHLGVAKRRYEFDGLVYTNPNGDTLGICDAVDEYTLWRFATNPAGRNPRTKVCWSSKQATTAIALEEPGID
jgi:hypothetical protein